MLNNILKYIEKLSINFDSIEQIDLLFERLCDKFASDESNQINSIRFILLDRFGYNPLTRPDPIKKLCIQRDGQNKFRKKLILRDKKCLITCDNYEVCEAAHIIPYSESKSFDIGNGLLLNRCLHKMFDKYLWSINSLDCVEFSKQIWNLENFHNYNRYNGVKLNISDDCKKYLSTHYKKFLEFNSDN